MKQAFYKLPKIFSQFTNCLITQIEANIYIHIREKIDVLLGCMFVNGFLIIPLGLEKFLFPEFSLACQTSLLQRIGFPKWSHYIYIYIILEEHIEFVYNQQNYNLTGMITNKVAFKIPPKKYFSSWMSFLVLKISDEDIKLIYM